MSHVRKMGISTKCCDLNSIWRVLYCVSAVQKFYFFLCLIAGRTHDGRTSDRVGHLRNITRTNHADCSRQHTTSPTGVAPGTVNTTPIANCSWTFPPKFLSLRCQLGRYFPWRLWFMPRPLWGTKQPCCTQASNASWRWSLLYHTCLQPATG